MNVSPNKLASVLLQYPTTALFDGLGQLTETASRMYRVSREPFGIFLQWLSRTSPDTVAAHCVEAFGLRRRCALYLTYYRYGGTRKRGMAILASKAAYWAVGFKLVKGEGEAGGELPDYQPLGIFVAGHVWRWRYDQFGWTSRSTQLQERRLLKDAALPRKPPPEQARTGAPRPGGTAIPHRCLHLCTTRGVTPGQKRGQSAVRTGATGRISMERLVVCRLGIRSGTLVPGVHRLVPDIIKRGLPWSLENVPDDSEG